MQKIYLLLGEEQQGPYSEEEVRELYVAGKISPETLHWKDDMSDWQALGPRDGQTGESRPAPKTVAPPRRTLKPGKYPVEHKLVKLKDKDEEPNDFSAPATPAWALKAVGLVVVLFILITFLFKTISHTMPDLGKRFAAMVNRQSNSP